jgi:hypothetical protein
MSALVAPIEPWIPENASDREWVVLAAVCPVAAATIGRYVQQLATFLAPRSVEVADTTLRQLVRWMAAETDVTTVAGLTRTHLEDYKVWLAAQPGISGGNLAQNTQRHRLRMIRIFFERLIEWDWADVPPEEPALPRGHRPTVRPAAQVPL